MVVEFMKIIYGDVFTSDCDYIGITTNSIVKRNGELVMGAGVALTAKKINPQLLKIIGRSVLEMGVVGGFYGIIKCGKYFAFQTKRHYKDKSDIRDVYESILLLKGIAERFKDKTFALPFPAVNNGGLTRDEVSKYLMMLPDNVFVYDLINKSQHEISCNK